jgi:hypothetical protein
MMVAVYGIYKAVKFRYHYLYTLLYIIRLFFYWQAGLIASTRFKIIGTTDDLNTMLYACKRGSQSHIDRMTNECIHFGVLEKCSGLQQKKSHGKAYKQMIGTERNDQIF